LATPEQATSINTASTDRMWFALIIRVTPSIGATLLDAVTD